ncbi:hypothetical protein CERSUDRAFT_118793 [Gelatoporia subvermispora B]|uniref:Uncharacterized protein n=1 Tax=Ceriporiopsis subvermispora (strain B) TaxID=914234 RepID=M2Q6M5_CERS8|nr:hypothetical protein CERSUDRAFT_118793 [Gelatoporia subvermispora B]
MHQLDHWKSTPSTRAVLLGIELPYRPPRSAPGALLWRKRVWLEATFGLSLLEPWEKVLMLTIICTLLTLVLTGLYTFLPQYAALLQRRTAYYLLGREDVAL